MVGLNIEVFIHILFLLSHGDQGIPQLFRVQNANLRARVALQALENWPLSAGRELLEFCLNDPSTESSLRTDLEVKKKELDIYHWVILVGKKPETLRNVALMNSLSFLLLRVVFQCHFIHVTFLFQMLTLNPPLPWATWQELRSESNSNSEAILSKMLEAKVSHPMIKK